MELLKKFRGKTKKKHNGSSPVQAREVRGQVRWNPPAQGHRSGQGSRHPLRHVRRYVKQVDYDLQADATETLRKPTPEARDASGVR